MTGGNSVKNKSEEKGAVADHGGAGAADVVLADGGNHHNEDEHHDDHHQHPWYSRKGISHLLHNQVFHETIIGLVMFDLILVFIDLILAISTVCVPKANEGGSEPVTNETIVIESTPAVPTCRPNLGESNALVVGEAILYWLSVIILCIFAVEVFLNLYTKGWRFFLSFVLVVDGMVIYASLFMELYFKFTNTNASGSGGIVMLRIWKLVRAMHAIAHTIEMKAHAVIQAVQESNKRVEVESKAMLAAFSAKKQEFLGVISYLSTPGRGTIKVRKPKPEKSPEAEEEKEELIKKVGDDDTAASDDPDATMAQLPVEEEPEETVEVEMTPKVVLDEVKYIMEDVQDALKSLSTLIAKENREALQEVADIENESISDEVDGVLATSQDNNKKGSFAV